MRASAGTVRATTLGPAIWSSASGQRQLPQHASTRQQGRSCSAGGPCPSCPSGSGASRKWAAAVQAQSSVQYVQVTGKLASGPEGAGQLGRRPPSVVAVRSRSNKQQTCTSASASPPAGSRLPGECMQMRTQPLPLCPGKGPLAAQSCARGALGHGHLQDEAVWEVHADRHRTHGLRPGQGLLVPQLLGLQRCPLFCVLPCPACRPQFTADRPIWRAWSGLSGSLMGALSEHAAQT